MDGAGPSPFPQHSWFHFCVESDAAPNPLLVHLKCVAHAVSLTARGRHAIRSICRARELDWEEPTGTVHFLPADGEERTFVTAMSPDFESKVFLIPRRHLTACLNSEGLGDPAELRRLLVHDDPILQACLTRLSTGLSLHRFINQRRLRRAFEALKSPTASLADVSLDLGFSSQSHFTRLFSLITGMTPAKYAKQFRPTLG